MRRELFILVSASAIALGAACSSSSTTVNNTGTDSGVNTHPATDDSGAGGDTDSGGGDLDSGAIADGGFNGCATYVDNTAKAEVDLVWDTSVANLPDHCSKIKVGNTVKFTGSFTSHPLVNFGGDTPNPIAGSGTPDGGSVTITFTTPGTFGYHCDNHSIMIGAFVVVP